MSKVKTEATPFTNELGQVIKPGDSVLVVTSSTHTVHVGYGRYIGQRIKKNRWNNDKDDITVSVETDENRIKKLHKVTKQEWNWQTEPSIMGIPYPKARESKVSYPNRPYNRYGVTESDLKEYNRQVEAYQAERNAISDQYQIDRDQYYALKAEKEKDFENVDFPYVVRRGLQRNRIYLTNTSMADFANKKTFS
jgi:hypothetical protein